MEKIPEAPPPLLVATARQPVSPGTALSIDYTLHEWEFFEPFECEESGRMVAGFRHLTETQQDAAMPFAMAHIKSLYLQHLFGQSSRC